MNDPAVVLAAVHPRGEGAAGLDAAEKRLERAVGIGGVMQHAHGESEIRDPPQGQLKEIGADDMDPRILRGEPLRDEDGIAHVHGQVRLGPELSSQRPVAAHPAAELDGDLALEVFGPEWSDPVEKLLPMGVVVLVKPRPLVPEVLGSPARHFVEPVAQQMRHAEDDRERVTGGAMQFPGLHWIARRSDDAQLTLAEGTHHIPEKGTVHDAPSGRTCRGRGTDEHALSPTASALLIVAHPSRERRQQP